MRNYTQLTSDQRYQLNALKSAGVTQTEMAGIIGVNKATVCREFHRNTGQRGYRPKQAQVLTLQRRQGKSLARISPAVWQEIERLIRKGWSPEQISARSKVAQDIEVSHEWIYQYIYVDKANGGTLCTHLRCQKQRGKRYGSYDKRGVIPDKVGITERPEVVEARERCGDREGDTIIGKHHKGAALTLVDRKSLFTLMAALPSKHAEITADCAIDLLKSKRLPSHTITLDNGKEFTQHKKMAEEIGTDIYFAEPYSSWQRGVNENTNGLIRQYLPKSRDLTMVTDDESRAIMHRLNHRPRKTPGYKTPYEVFYERECKLTQRVALTS